MRPWKFLLITLVAACRLAAVFLRVWDQWEAASAAAAGAAAAAVAAAEARGRDAEVVDRATSDASDAVTEVTRIGERVTEERDEAAARVAGMSDSEKARRLDALGRGEDQA